MSEVVVKLRHVEIPEGTPYGWMHWCPACEKGHRIPTTPGGPLWSFNGDLERPTFSPSVKHEWEWGEQRERRCCHYFITNGVIQFCGDSTHKLAGKDVPLPDLPEEKPMPKTKWLVERTDCTPPKYLANFYGKEQWTEYAQGALQFDTETSAQTAWNQARDIRPELEEHNAHVELREHEFG